MQIPLNKKLRDELEKLLLDNNFQKHSFLYSIVYSKAYNDDKLYIRIRFSTYFHKVTITIHENKTHTYYNIDEILPRLPSSLKQFFLFNLDQFS